MSLRTRLTAVLLCVVVQTAAAQGDVPTSRPGEPIYEGELTVAGVKALLARYADRPPSLLTINSPGGDVMAGLVLGDWVRRHRIDVVVGGVCASSCANYVFPAGRRKTVRAGALVLWHGGAHQANFVAFQREFLDAAARRDWGVDSPADRRRLQGSVRFETLALYGHLETALFTALGVDPWLPTIGQCLPVHGAGWTLDVPAMRAMGLTDVDAPATYGSAADVQQWQQTNSARFPRAARLAIHTLSVDDVARARQLCKPPAFVTLEDLGAAVGVVSPEGAAAAPR